MSDLISDDSKYVWHPFTQHHTADEPLGIVEAKGTLLFDEKGNSYIDANSSWWVNVHGHGHPHIGNALNKQFEQLDHTVFAGVTHPKAVELSKRICGKLPDHFTRVFFSDNGSTAVEVALKMAIQYWHNKGIKKNRFIAIEGSYHGDTFGAMSVGQRGYFNTPFESLFFDTEYIKFPTEKNEKEILTEAEKLLSTKKIAGIIVEPLVQGAAGMQMYSEDFLDQLTSIAKKHESLVIFDEVMTGFGRTGELFAMDKCQNKPDIVALSKGLTAGVMALGLTVTSERIYEAFLGEETTKALLHGHSFTANPIACAVACASLDLFERSETKDSIEWIVHEHERFSNNLKKHSIVKNVRQSGTILAFELGDSDDNYFSNIRVTAYNHFLNDGVLLRPLGNTIFFNPPYCISEKEYEKVEASIMKLITLL